MEDEAHTACYHSSQAVPLRGCFSLHMVAVTALANLCGPILWTFSRTRTLIRQKIIVDLHEPVWVQPVSDLSLFRNGVKYTQHIVLRVEVL